MYVCGMLYLSYIEYLRGASVEIVRVQYMLETGTNLIMCIVQVIRVCKLTLKLAAASVVVACDGHGDVLVFGDQPFRAGEKDVEADCAPQDGFDSRLEPDDQYAPLS